MPAKKIACLGGGSLYFPRAISDLVIDSDLADSELVLYDIDAEKVEKMAAMGVRLAEQAGTGFTVRATVDLIDAARLRTEAIRIGITEIVQNRREIRIAPVALKTSQEVRLERLASEALVRGSTLYLPPPKASPATAIAEFLRTMWPTSTDHDGNV